MLIGGIPVTITNSKTAYFDNAATTFPKPESVYVFMDDFYRHYGVNVGRGQHRLADKASFLVVETRELLLKLFHCPSKQVIFTPSATEALNVILRGLPWNDGMNVYVSPFEHNAVTRNLNYIKRNTQINIIELAVDRKSLCYDLERIKYQFQENMPHAVVVSHASNVCGIVAPIQDMFILAKKYNATTIVDMAQTAGLIDTNLSVIPADFAVFAGHKTLYGPLGIAGFISSCVNDLQPMIYGGTGVDSANPDLPDALPERFEAGSPNIAAIAGLNAALKWINEIGLDWITKKEQENMSKLLTLLGSYANIKVVSLSEGKQIGVVSCVFEGYSSDSIGKVLSNHDIAVRTGLHCAPTAHRFLGTFPAGTVRFSVSYFNQDDDFEMLRVALDDIEENG